MSSAARLWALVGLPVVLGACASFAPRPQMSPTRVEALVAQHRRQATTLEQGGYLQRALDEWKIALTIDPDDAAAQAGARKLETRIAQAVSDRLRQGREALGRGALPDARRHLLAVLALDPANRDAFEALRAAVRGFRFVTHKVRGGETLAEIAQRYYGDRSRSEVIWEVNRLAANSKLVAGMTLKIPEVAGVPFLARGARLEDAPEVSTADAAPSGPPGATTPTGEALEVNPLLADARDAFEAQEYETALTDVDNLLAGSPGHAEGVELKKAILYRWGKSQLDDGRYAGSYQALTELARLDPGYRDSAALRGRVRRRLIEDLYQEGIRLYRDENIEDAIAKWRAVLEYDPNHADARRNIEQAERLLRALQQRQQEKQ